LNCDNVAKHTEFYLGQLEYNANFIGKEGCFKKALRRCSKCYCVASVNVFVTFAIQ
jgi:hypothetical protein